MWLASVDGAVTPVEEARIPVTDEGLLRGDGGFEVLRVYGGPPVRARRPLRAARRARAPGCGWRPTSTRCAPRRSRVGRGEPESLLRLVVTRGGRRIAIVEPLPARPRDRARGDRHLRADARAQRAQDALLRGQHARRAAGEGAGRRRGAARHAARPRARGPDVDVLLGRAAAACTRRRWPTGSSTRSPAARLLEECDVTEAPCTLDDVRAAEEAFIASSVREVMPIAAVDDIELPAAPGPGHRGRARGVHAARRAGAGGGGRRGLTAARGGPPPVCQSRYQSRCRDAPTTPCTVPRTRFTSMDRRYPDKQAGNGGS